MTENHFYIENKLIKSRNRDFVEQVILLELQDQEPSNILRSTSLKTLIENNKNKKSQ